MEDWEIIIEYTGGVSIYDPSGFRYHEELFSTESVAERIARWAHSPREDY